MEFEFYLQVFFSFLFFSFLQEQILQRDSANLIPYAFCWRQLENHKNNIVKALQDAQVADKAFYIAQSFTTSNKKINRCPKEEKYLMNGLFYYVRVYAQLPKRVLKGFSRTRVIFRTKSIIYLILSTPDQKGRLKATEQSAVVEEEEQNFSRSLFLFPFWRATQRFCSGVKETSQ